MLLRFLESEMKVRAKFKVQNVTESEGGLKSALLSPVTSGSKENEEFYKWTPGGQINLSTMNPAAAAQFVPGRVFYVDITPEDDAPPESIPRDNLTGDQLRGAYDGRAAGQAA